MDFNFTTLNYDIDFTYCFPYGLHDIPQIEVLSGDYLGLKFDLKSSAVSSKYENNQIKHALSYEYVIHNMWLNVSKQQFDGKHITLNEKDQNVIHNLVYNYIKHFTEEQTKISVSQSSNIDKKITNYIV
jgi:hypothetical protein